VLIKEEKMITAKSVWLKCIASVFFIALLASCGGGGGGGGGGATSTVNSGTGAGNGLSAKISGPATWYVQTGLLVNLDGSYSSGGTAPLTYSWSIQSKPAGSTTKIDGSGTVKPEFEADVAGLYTVQLVVSDGVTSSTPATATVSVSGPTTGWTRMGEVLDVNYGQQATNPTVATDSSGNAVVVWEETDPNTANAKNIYAKKWNGSSWTLLGNALDTNIADDVYQPVVAIDPTDNNPVVAWQEQDGVRKVYVKKWNGSAWIALGSALNNNTAKNAYSKTSMAISTTGKIYVAWEEDTYAGLTNLSDVFVKSWNGSAWVQLGNAFNANDTDTDPALAIDPSNGNLVLAWSQGIWVAGYYFGKIDAEKWDGSAWTALGQMDFGGTFNAVNTAIAIGADKQPIVAWADVTNIAPSTVAVAKYNSSTLLFGGGIMTPYPAGGALWPSLLVDPSDQQPILAFEATDSIFVKKWDAIGSVWTQYGSKVSYWPSPGAPSVAFGASGKIIVTWSEGSNNKKNVYVKMLQ
jgi:hypothetical protein